MSTLSRASTAVSIVCCTVIARPLWLAVVGLGIGGTVTLVWAVAGAWTDASADRYAKRQAESLAALELPPSAVYGVRNWWREDPHGPENDARGVESGRLWDVDREQHPVRAPRHAAPANTMILAIPVEELAAAAAGKPVGGER